MRISHVLITVFGLVTNTHAQDEFEASAATAAPSRRFAKITEWHFPKHIRCTLQVASGDSITSRDIYSSTILRAVQNKANTNHCVDNTAKAERGTQDCSVTFTPEPRAGDPVSGWSPLYIQYKIWGQEPTATKFRFENGYIYQVSQSNYHANCHVLT